ncbi:acyl carrier protein [Clostridium acetobutylicum]|uniref:Acyl carrier protein n=1 Tax=Clostridium acetobutylicum (strain ATCC 824 / DSM 792 / JCM 1419 / IAM 19013 / LMG 5710 / NBRC 13948 / NRRL B-527 / VKM B-1787 / 2291 / W) TaxID=272562 RepID=Q97H16_CLOAB|nr:MULTISPECIES: phosphopantetheine-binding protein [Clostridium]AAK80155.1 Acyl carrier protein [Clostridium acetobutylicum ATCC 824]ADZ21249.1 Acyl carrier protein [Clostridium acetobutylicum EA 2018]AEI33812.1 Acyl carrier protein [Clostridium acetobutylicum DSM 1731]AWV79419.1 acyl carrier protein [Clostridium acetobutylicum]MBC2394609.1 acyl carrier protein [Clostridium acetobutylicum]
MDKLKAIFAEVLDIDIEDVKDSTERDVIDEWDSFSHLMLINELENRLKIKFTMDEVESIKTFKDLEKTVSKKC